MTLTEIVAALMAAGPAARAAADSAITALEAVSPDAIKGTEEQIRAGLDTELAKLSVTVADLQAAIQTAGATLAAGRGPTKGGPDATIA